MVPASHTNYDVFSGGPFCVCPGSKVHAAMAAPADSISTTPARFESRFHVQSAIRRPPGNLGCLPPLLPLPLPPLNVRRCALHPLASSHKGTTDGQSGFEGLHQCVGHCSGKRQVCKNQDARKMSATGMYTKNRGGVLSHACWWQCWCKNEGRIDQWCKCWKIQVELKWWAAASGRSCQNGACMKSHEKSQDHRRHRSLPLAVLAVRKVLWRLSRCTLL